jgi:periplasmic serine protease, Do/DeqQ family
MGRFLSIRRPVAALSLVAALVIGALIALFLTASWYGRAEEREPAFVATTRAQGAADLGTLAPTVRRVTPAVVNISSTRVVKVEERRLPPIFQDPRFRDFFGFDEPREPRPEERRQQGLGSGVIISPDGYIVTNNHVVEGATDIIVSTTAGKTVHARIVGTDPLSDIAVLKVDEKNLPVLALDDSIPVQVGDFCLAIGNMFGLGQTVTFGIIGATGRAGFGIETYEDFIQTDAAINPGNSGGALVNLRGQLIGINTAIISRTGGHQGIGFAIPMKMVRPVVEQLIRTGKVVRGYIGVTIEEVTPALARGLNLAESRGVIVTSAAPGSPAERAGLQRGDVILSANGQAVESVTSFRLRVSQMQPGQTLTLRVLRENQQRDVRVQLGELPAQQSGNEEWQEPGEPAADLQSTLGGVAVDRITPQLAQQLDLPAGTTGVVVTSVRPASEAFAAGLRPGDVIQELNRQPVRSPQDFRRLAQQFRNSTVVLLVNRRGQTTFIPVEPPAR